MKTVYEHFSSQKFDEPLPKQGKGRVKAIHYIQSFDPKDNFSPELAHQIARAFARKAFGDSCQVVIATHNDKNHVHNHIIINTYGIDGRKFNANKKTLDELKEVSDRVCLAFGIQPFNQSKAKRTTVAYNEWQSEQHGTSWKQKIRLEIEVSIKKYFQLLQTGGRLCTTLKKWESLRLSHFLYYNDLLFRQQLSRKQHQRQYRTFVFARYHLGGRCVPSEIIIVRVDQQSKFFDIIKLEYVIGIKADPA